MLHINGMEVHEILSDLWEYEREQNRLEYQDENGELNCCDDISFLSFSKTRFGAVEYKIFLYNNKVFQKAVPSKVLSLFNTSIQSILVNHIGYSLTTDLFNVLYDFKGKIKMTEEL
jgi:hypothetical protein